MRVSGVPRRQSGGTLTVGLLLAVGCGSGGSPAPKAPMSPDEAPVADAAPAHVPPVKETPDAKVDPGPGPSTPDAAPPAPDTEVPPTSVPEGSFSNPAAVKVPSFPDKNCPVAVGASTAAI